jgi:hypothetical protein
MATSEGGRALSTGDRDRFGWDMKKKAWAEGLQILMGHGLADFSQV